MKYDSIKIKTTLLLFLLVLLSACAPDRFTLDKISGQNRIEGFEMMTIHDAEVKYDNAFILNENGSVSLRATNQTDGIWDFGMNFLFGNELNIAFRNVPYEYSPSKGIVLNISQEKITLSELGKIQFSEIGKYNFSNTVRVQLANDGYNYSLIIDCDTVYKGISTLPSTEYIIFESLHNTKSFISGIDFRKK